MTKNCYIVIKGNFLPLHCCKTLIYMILLDQELTLKRLGGQFDPNPPPSPPPPPTLCGFSKNLSSKERLKPWFFVTFNIIISGIFPEISLKFLKSFRKYEEFLCQYYLFSSIFIEYLDCLTFLCYKETNNV